MQEEKQMHFIWTMGRSLYHQRSPSTIPDSKVKLVPPLWEKPFAVVWASGCPRGASSGRCSRRVQLRGDPSKDLGHTGEAVSWLAWEDVAVGKDVWASLLELLPPATRLRNKRQADNGWISSSEARVWACLCPLCNKNGCFLCPFELLRHKLPPALGLLLHRKLNQTFLLPGRLNNPVLYWLTVFLNVYEATSYQQHNGRLTCFCIDSFTPGGT